MPELRKPKIVPINDHVWLLDDHHQATCYVVAGTKLAAVIDTSIGLANIREAAESLTSFPLICINAHGHEDHTGR
jgi:glyoxylase-like metal-dependent hydrolase (beta-lactamase superfamily II)